MIFLMFKEHTERRAWRTVRIDQNELGVRCRNVWNFAQGLNFKADFHSKMIVCRQELGMSQATPATILTLGWPQK